MALFHLLHSKRSGEVTHEAADLIIGVDNISSQRAFSNAGFKDTGKKYVDDSDGWEATVWCRGL